MKAVKMKTPNPQAGPAKKERINVVTRIRPLTSSEQRGGVHRCLDVNRSGSKVVITKGNRQQEFPFSKVFGPKATQEQIYNELCAPLLEDVMLGYSCTIFAYGQTGTGKTYTLEGTRENGVDKYAIGKQAGIIPRTMYHLLKRLNKDYFQNFGVEVSIIEMYNEKLIDLLDDNLDQNKVIKIVENENKEQLLSGAKSTKISTQEEVFDLLRKITQQRHTAETKMNAQSSRSHVIFQATVSLQNPDTNSMVTGKFFLVDLAGSENIGRSEAKGV